MASTTPTVHAPVPLARATHQRHARFLGLHETCTAITSGSILAFFGSTVMYPKEILGNPYDLTAAWIPVILVFFVDAAFLLGSFLRGRHGHAMLLVANVATAIGSLAVTLAFVAYTTTNMEPWVVQLAWFLRDNGILTGLYLGSAAFAAIMAVTSMLARAPIEKDAGRDVARRLGIVVACIAAGFAISSIMYRHVSPFSVLLVQVVASSISAGSSILPGLGSWASGDPPVACLRGETRFHRPRRGPIARGNDPLRAIHDRLEAAGTERLAFWWTLVLLCLGNAGILVFILDAFPRSTADSMMLVLIAFLVVFVSTVFSRARRRSDAILAGNGIRRIHTGGLAWVDGIRCLLVVVVACGACYYFPYVMYLPDVLARASVFAVAGALACTAAWGRRWLATAIYAACVMVLLLTLQACLVDAVTNAYNYYGPEDVYFPFLFIHGWEHAAMVGIPAGYLSCHEILSLARWNDGGDATQRGIVISMLAMIVPGLASYSSWGIWNQFPGGKIETWQRLDVTFQGNQSFYLTTFVLMAMAVAALLLMIVKNAYLAALARRHRASSVRWTASSWSGSPVRARGPLLPRFKAIVIAVAATSGLLIGGSLAIAASFEASRSRPILHHEPGAFAFWLANSTERVSPTERVFLSPRGVIDRFAIHAAANEHVAFQVVWTPLGKSMNDVRCTFSPFVHEANGSWVIPPVAFRARHVQNILGGAFPDILVPFTTLQFHGSTNQVLWITSIIPHDSHAGKYSGTLDITYDFNVERSHENKTVPISFDIHVWNFTIPQTRHLRTQMDGRSDPASLQSFIDHRINDYGIGIPSTLNTSDNTWTYDWASWDANIQWKLDRGANSFIIRGGPGFTYGDDRSPFVDNATLMTRLENWLAGVEAHLVAKNWTPYGYIYYIDEFQMFIPDRYERNRTRYFNDIAVQLAAMKAAAPSIRIMTTTPPSLELAHLMDDIDIYCPIADDYDKETWNTLMANGKEFWMYFCVGPTSPWPNSHLYNRLYETRIMLWQAFLYGLQGFLYWSSNAEYHGGYGFAFNGWGDGWFIHYDDAGNPRDSPRWENYLDAQEDFEYLWLASRALGWLRANSSAFTAAELDQLDARARNALTSVVGERESYTQDPRVLHRARHELGQLLHGLSVHADIAALSEEPWSPVP